MNRNILILAIVMLSVIGTTLADPCTCTDPLTNATYEIRVDSAPADYSNQSDATIPTYYTSSGDDAPPMVFGEFQASDTLYIGLIGVISTIIYFWLKRR